MQWREVTAGNGKNMFRVSKRVLAFLETDHEVDMNWVERILKNMLDGKLCYEKANGKLIMGPYQTPIAIQMTFATSDSIRLLRFAIPNKKKLSGPVGRN